MTQRSIGSANDDKLNYMRCVFIEHSLDKRRKDQDRVWRISFFNVATLSISNLSTDSKKSTDYNEASFSYAVL